MFGGGAKGREGRWGGEDAVVRSVHVVRARTGREGDFGQDLMDDLQGAGGYFLRSGLLEMGDELVQVGQDVIGLISAQLHGASYRMMDNRELPEVGIDIPGQKIEREAEVW
jgi:hypothetical protein